MSSPGQEFVEVFLQEASEHLQFLREYAGILLDPYPAQEDLERLYMSAHTLKGSSGMYGFPLFSEVAAKLTHIFQYAMNVGISSDAASALVEFVSEAVAVLESNLWMISSNASEAADDIAAFKTKYPFAFQAPAETQGNEIEEEQVLEAPAPETTDVETPALEASPVVAPVIEPPAIAKPEEKLESPGSAVEVTEESADACDPLSEEAAHEKPSLASEQPALAAEAPAEAVDPVCREFSVETPVENSAEIQPPPEIAPAFNLEVTEPPEPLVAAALAHDAPPIQSPEIDHSQSGSEADFDLPPDGDISDEILEFFVPEVEEHLQAVTECLLALETNPNDDDVHRLFRAMHTIKGSAAQVGLPRLALVAHRAEDLIGRLRDGALKPGVEIIDLCLESVDTLKKFLYRQWSDDVVAQQATKSLLARIAKLVPLETEEEAGAPSDQAAATVVVQAPVEIPTASAAKNEFPSTRPVEDPIALGEWMNERSPAQALALEPGPLDDLLVSNASDETSIDDIKHVEHTSADTSLSGDTIPTVADQQVAAHHLPVTAQEGEVTAPGASAAALETKPSELAQAGVSVGSDDKAFVAGAATVPSVAGKATPPPSAPVLAGTVSAPVAVNPPGAGVTSLVPSAPAEDSSAAADVERLLGLKKDNASSVPLSRSVRIALERLDRMMNAVGELVINRTRMLGRVAELERLADVLNFSKARMSDKITEFQEKYEFSRITGLDPMNSPLDNRRRSASSSYDFGSGSAGFDSGENFPFRGGYSSYAQKFDGSLAEFSELEMDRYDEFSILSRSLTEISADITEILTQLDGFVRRVDSDIDEFTKLAHRLQDEITAARMVPIGNLYTRISRTVRDAAKAAGKQVELQLAGAETELDNNIIQQIADPLLHLVRNAVAHGIESAEERYDQGKPDNGNLYVRAYHRGNHIYIEVEDDGRGLDYEKVRATAVELGFVPAERASKLTERDLQNLLFHPGFSTAPRKTELAGRGVGLDVVRANVAALNGEIEIETQKGFGIRFTLKVPLTLIISQALFVRCGASVFAFPLAFVEEIRRIREEQIEEVGGKLLTKVRDVVTEVVCLDRQLGLQPIEPLNGYYRLVIVNIAGRQVGIVVEEVLRKDEIVIKNLGEYLRNVKLFPGATIAPDGSLILLVDVNRLIAGEAIERRPLMTATNAARLFFPGASALASGEVPDEAIDRVPEEKVVVLADDSISVRKFVGRMLEKSGFRVKLACDGLEALEIVSQTRCDLVVTDLEMPRTNGYELMAHLKQNPETRDIPVMVVTSRAGAKHRDKAIKQGAADFLVKPVQEDQFVAAVERLIGKASEARAAVQVAHQPVQGRS